MKTTSKTPYEIRLDLLQLAFNILSANISTADKNCGLGPSVESVILLAERMNKEFVSKCN